jgi:glycosyltransferase involved in cell wall biosynthesis
MRVLLTIHHHLDPNSGAPGVTWQLARALRAAGHDAETFSWDDLPDRLGARAREALFPEFVARRIVRAARERVDVVDAASCDVWLWGFLRPRGRGPTLVTRSHGLERTFWDARRAQARADGEAIPLLERLYHGGVRLRESQISLRRADAALFLNRADRERAVRELGVAHERAHVVANGVDAAFLGRPAPGAEEASAGRAAPPLRLAQVGSWAARKGAAVVAAALARPLADGTVRLALLGTAVPRAEVLAAFPAAARERVDVVPRYERSELPALLAEHEVLLLPSFAEGFSLALLEGMACGLAPVATTVGSAPDVLTDGVDALLVAPGDAGALTAAVERLARDRELLARLREAAHRTAQGFSWERVVTDTVALYERAAP